MKFFIALALLASTAMCSPMFSMTRSGDGVQQEASDYQDLMVRGSVCSGSGSKLSKAEQDAYLKQHNDCRQKEGAGLSDLTWDDGLASRAQDLVNQQSNCNMQHKLLECNGKRLGQNLAWDWSSNTQSGNMPASKAVGMWYDEKKDYNLATNSCSRVCGHYTQIVWAKTQKVGCAARVCGNSRLVACDYYPPGNWIGQKPY